MNLLVVLVMAMVLCISWIAALRYLGPKSAIQKRDPASAEQRFEWVRALRDLSFFFAMFFILSTVFIFLFSFIIALIDPPVKNSFTDSFSQIVSSVSQDRGVLGLGSVWGALLLLLSASLAVGISQRLVRGRFIKDIGLKYYKMLPLDVLFGILLGIFLVAVVFFTEVVTGFIAGNAAPSFNWGEIALWFVISLCVAFSEELVVRGYILQTVNSAWGGGVAIVASSAFWGLGQLFYPNSSFSAALNIAFAGLIFAYAYIITGYLWLPIALHFSWIFAEGAIFGYPVGGFTMPAPILQPLVEGPEAIIGTRFGPESGLIGVFVILLGGLLLFGWNKARPQNKRG